MYTRILNTADSKLVILIRIMVGAVFFSEGIQKFIFPAIRGMGRFEKIGFPAPEFFAGFVGVFEILCGLLLILGLLTRPASLAMLINMSVALITTKLPIYIGHGFGPFVVKSQDMYGFWAMAHEMRTDWAMWIGSLFLLISGGGAWSIDRYFVKNKHPVKSSDHEEN